MPAFFSQPGTVEGCRIERVCFISEGERSVSANSAGLGYVGFEYVLCRGPRPGRWVCGGLEGEGWLEDAEGGLGDFSAWESAGEPSWVLAVWVSGSGPGRVPVTMSASQSPRPPGTASTAV